MEKTIKSLLNLELEQAKIDEIFGVSKQKVYYWMKIRIKTEQKLKKKWDKKNLINIIDNKRTMKKGNLKAYNLINKPEKKFKNSIMIQEDNAIMH